MTRAFRPDPLPIGLLDDLVDLAARSPSAGKTQGWHLVVLEGEATARFWDITLPLERRASFRWQQLLDAPVIAVVLADPQAYVDRYAEPDKASTGLGEGVGAWPTPYWTVDAAMATMSLLLAAEDAGIGALFFGVFRGEDELRAALSIPDRLEVIGALAFGFPAVGDDRPGRSADRPRRGAAAIMHRDLFSDG
jgi:nitroreductase